MNKYLYIVKAIHQRGVGFLFDYFKECILFDLRRGTSTSSRVPKVEQPLNNENSDVQDGLLYVASFTSVTRNSVKTVFDYWGSENFFNAQYMDLGCGKGKTLIIFEEKYKNKLAHKPIGIEYDENLSELGKRNLEKSFKEPKSEIYCDSAINLKKYARSDHLLIYLYNSFQGETLQRTLDELSEYKHIVIYVDPVEAKSFQDRGYGLIHSQVGKYNADTWSVFEYEPK
ncbi:MAG: hypothetical protein AB8G77_25180 [Rhodothermales bacterium]